MTDTLTISLRPVASVCAIKSLWDQVSSRPHGSFFTSWTWLGTWLELLPQPQSVRLLTVRQGDQRGLALLVLRQVRRHQLLTVRQLHFNSTGDPQFDCIFIEHNGFAGIRPDCSVWQEVGQWFLGDHSGGDELVIPGVEGRDASTSGGELQRHREVPAFRMSLNATREHGGFEATLSRNSRQQLRRAFRDYGSPGSLAFDVARTAERALSYFDALKAFHVRSWTRRGKPHAFRHAFFETFHRALIARGVTDGSVRLICVTAAGQPVGYLYNFRYGATEYAYQSGFEDSDPDLRPGYVCHALAIEAAASEGAAVYDF